MSSLLLKTMGATLQKQILWLKFNRTVNVTEEMSVQRGWHSLQHGFNWHFHPDSLKQNNWISYPHCTYATIYISHLRKWFIPFYSPSKDYMTGDMISSSRCQPNAFVVINSDQHGKSSHPRAPQLCVLPPSSPFQLYAVFIGAQKQEKRSMSSTANSWKKSPSKARRLLWLLPAKLDL